MRRVCRRPRLRSFEDDRGSGERGDRLSGSERVGIMALELATENGDPSRNDLAKLLGETGDIVGCRVRHEPWLGAGLRRSGGGVLATFPPQSSSTREIAALILLPSVLADAIVKGVRADLEKRRDLVVRRRRILVKVLSPGLGVGRE